MPQILHRRAACLSIACVVAACATAQAATVADGQVLDFDGDGIAEVTFHSGDHLDPGSLPTGAITRYYSVGYTPGPDVAFDAQVAAKTSRAWRSRSA